jgi:hypothetical protein
MTNEVVQAMQIHYWGTGSEWLWAFWQFIAVGLQFIVVAITLWFIAKQVKIQTDSHVVQSVCALQERWHSEYMQRVRLDVCTRWKKNNQDFDGACEQIAEFIEELGMFLKIKAIPEDVMWDFQSWNIECYWAMFKDGIIKLRTDCKDDTLYEDFEKMFNVMSEINKREGVNPKNTKDINEFIEREIRSTRACLNIRERGTT